MYGLLAIILLVIGYFFGCFSTGYIVGKMNGHDIRTEGSGNIGTTNALRTMGAKGGALTFGGDLLKAFIPTLVVRFVMCPRMDMDLEYTYLFTLIVGLGVVIGHNFPFELSFQGRKRNCCVSSGDRGIFGRDQTGVVDDRRRYRTFCSSSSTDKICISWLIDGNMVFPNLHSVPVY